MTADRKGRGLPTAAFTQVICETKTLKDLNPCNDGFSNPQSALNSRTVDVYHPQRVKICTRFCRATSRIRRTLEDHVVLSLLCCSLWDDFNSFCQDFLVDCGT
ncbi:hypothetical protein XENOCAPTIV_011905 [Xenoophorus captivus]|uniref:Uncharacterized protein n=1 Tax=Xenoophorus captivus TaxID=1517983 RepID=A0ABV0R8N0_9TELE